MTDYSELRHSAEYAMDASRFCAMSDFRQYATPTVIIGLLDEFDALRAQIKPTNVARNDYPPEFLLAYKAAKWRSGSTPAAAYKAWKARVAAGATPAEMQMGVEKYARYCAATGCEVKQAQTFFGPGEHFTADWTIPAGAQKGKLSGPIGKQDYSAGVGPDGSF
jgi:hypothetical protein